ncbi:WecB/TagA/CpsF family glycosyltransferase [Bacillus sp. AFS053548]|uniref:WecB/TagA/CpsF family glycosyltransferase n=1 Tax=Bacillus sp. AFS053548 TaxID=2033505 RepID=UPI000BFE5C64|nr:WecB/TagA/CpsF family glycosyltransferase [Bacillus sp. AFS053548]PGM56744.1 glycosyltransferase [Bacillus sp. AFS053548]
MNKRIKLLGSYLDCLTMEETIERTIVAVENKEKIQHVVINASKINLMYDNKDLQNIVNSCPIINADGQSIVWAGRFLGHSIPERVAGIDLFDNLIKVCVEKGYKPYFFGAKQQVVEKVVEHYLLRYPDLKIAGFRNGYFNSDESVKIAEDICKSGADMLFVAFSSPKKEFWINENMPFMKVPFAMGVGGSFDVIAGEMTRAPLWMQKFGLEWFHRFIQEPRRMFKRYVIGNFRFLCKTLKEKYKY